MDFVKIRGKDLQDCIMQMKMKYGPEAHLYDQRVITEGGLFGTGLMAQRMYEIDVGVPEKQNSKERIERKLKDLKELIKQKQRTESLPESGLVGMASNQPSHSIGANLHRKKNIDSVRPFSERRRRQNPPVYELETLEEKPVGLSISEAKDSILEVPAPSKLQFPERHPHIQKLIDRLLNEGMSSGFLEEMAIALERRLSAVDLTRYANVTDRAVTYLEERIQIDSDLFSGTPRGKRKVIFFVGPTGSGKTTSIAKLAAKYSLHMGKKVSLYTTDNYRIAAIDQLKFYADAMGLPFYAAKDLRKMKETIVRDGSELILVDTAGYSHRKSENLEKLQEFYQVFGEKDYIETILVLSSTVSKDNALAVANAYESVGYKRILLTKLDEAEFLGSVVELADTIHREFAFLSVGQDVPFDILNASKKLLAECVIFPEKLKGIAGEVFEKTV
ncbi:flagellar biosynthesis protein FlhF [Leptospira sp. 2 VSF19]|uniref:Flagellar biosynthesis protein FlhF n=1 Tax=Leptospira soteropolitanensis TaxID=2950025 RepID=A0AAW5VS18_9LEPT|nr:flagellar biosynthesis protein FlhF [Leptospira soteropolitanensis]MCW7493937.1 flagellar biosynthesis protein FlhF [Leptospira soteropolitanensis]MCW7501531.1 flagellar biosynthesis protein FlhF [Leptospira soteropolitanensis]MCW7523707.1 flagellar biosynthesis protein FlhF [Leptospira soteropolitanensis]MCW7527570.1 flagellar biosynthesis protein FlhF [Leptospira soteropolitanensis]MCW7531424.1 flagellar biosynthesis protein FlhF [Leptospira soteropolitanensis]